MTCRPLTPQEADELRTKYWPRVVDALTREPGESLLDWEARAKAVRESLRAASSVETKGGCPTCKSPEPHRHPTNDFGEATRSCKDEWHTVNRSRVEQPLRTGAEHG